MMRLRASVIRHALVVAILLASASVLAVGAANQAGASVAGRNVASATPNAPLTAQGCAGDVCMFLSSPSNGYAYVTAWAYTKTFYGHFHLTGPDGLSRNSPATTWKAGGPGWYSGIFQAIVGKYCGTAWHYTTDLGTACENIE